MMILKPTSQFRKDYKVVKKRGLDLTRLEEVINTLLEGKPLNDLHRDHSLTGSYAGCRECHIQPDWLLIYCIMKDELILVVSRTGSHSDLF